MAVIINAVSDPINKAAPKKQNTFAPRYKGFLE
jgi:hypothetical protein